MKIDGKISGAVFRHVETETGISFVENEPVVEVRLKSHENSNSTNVTVLSYPCAQKLVEQIRLALDL